MDVGMLQTNAAKLDQVLRLEPDRQPAVIERLLAEIADPSYSILTRKGDAGELADALAIALEGRLRDAARQYKARTWDDCAAEVTRILNRSDCTTSEIPELEAVG